jgi:tRNA 2-thiouridine synthesizing protein E
VDPLAVAGKRYPLDSFGFLADPSLWDEDFARGMAEHLRMSGGLGERHFEVIAYLRIELRDHGTVPFFVPACRAMGLRLHELRELFPAGYVRGACRIAGIAYGAVLQKSAGAPGEAAAAPSAVQAVDSLGYLVDFDTWDEAFARRVAEGWDLGSGVTEAHWKVVRYLRNHYAMHRATPLVYEVISANGLSIDAFFALFPEG